MMTNRALAARADHIAERAPRGGVQRQASRSLAAALRATGNLADAGQALEALEDPAVRLTAGQLLVELTTGTTA